MDDRFHAPPGCFGQQFYRGQDVDSLQRRPMVSGLVILAEIGSRVEDDVAAVKGARQMRSRRPCRP